MPSKIRWALFMPPRGLSRRPSGLKDEAGGRGGCGGGGFGLLGMRVSPSDLGSTRPAVQGDRIDPPARGPKADKTHVREPARDHTAAPKGLERGTLRRGEGRRRCVFTAAIIFGSTARPILTTAAALANVPADQSGGGESIVLDDQP
jgi:hypothetical protein